MEQTIVRQAFELTQAKAKIDTLGEALEALRKLARDNQEEITKLRPEAELLALMRKSLRESFRNIPFPHPLVGQVGVVEVSYGDFEVSVVGIACGVKYELNGSSYSVDFKLVPVPANEKRINDLYPGRKFDVWSAPIRGKSTPNARGS